MDTSDFVCLGLGFAGGWLFFKRPEFVTRFYNWVKARLPS